MSSMSELIQKLNKTLKNVKLIEKIRFWQKIDYFGFFDIFKYISTNFQSIQNKTKLDQYQLRIEKNKLKN